jgi:hypothetical protein
MRSGRGLFRTLVVSIVAAAMTSVVAAARPIASNSQMVESTEAQEQRLLNELVAGFTDRKILQAEIVKPPAAFRAEPALWVAYTVRDTPESVAVHGSWQADVVSGLFRKLAADRGWPPLKGETLKVLLPSGQTRIASAGRFGSVAHSTTPAAVTTLTAILRSSARTAGTTLRKLTMARLSGYFAPELVVSVKDAKAFMNQPIAIIWKVAGPVVFARPHPLAEGVLVEVISARGSWLASAGYAARIASGTSATRPR